MRLRKGSSSIFVILSVHTCWRAGQGFRTYLPGLGCLVLRPNDMYASFKVSAGSIRGVQLRFLIRKLIFVSTSPDIDTLRLHGTEYGSPQLPAEPASDNISLTDVGAIIISDGAACQRRVERRSSRRSMAEIIL